MHMGVARTHTPSPPSSLSSPTRKGGGRKPQDSSKLMLFVNASLPAPPPTPDTDAIIGPLLSTEECGPHPSLYSSRRIQRNKKISRSGCTFTFTVRTDRFEWNLFSNHPIQESINEEVLYNFNKSQFPIVKCTLCIVRIFIDLRSS